MSECKISVIVPCYNVENYIDRCIESIVNQSLKDIEIILVDDGSPDRVPAICEEWKQRDSRVKVIHKSNGGLGMACNSGLEQANGKYIAFVDSDDWIELDMYMTMYSIAEKYNAEMVFSGIQRVDANGKVSLLNQAETMKIYASHPEIQSLMLNMIASEPSSQIERKVAMSAKVILYKKNHIQKNNVRFESERQFISEDLLFNLDCLSKASCVVEIPKTFYNYYCNTSSLTNKIRIDRFEKTCILCNELLQRYHDMPKEFKTRVQRMLIGYARSSIKEICHAATISRKRKLKLLKGICKNECWEPIRREYPIKTMPFKHKLLLYLILNRRIYILFIILKH